MVVSFDRRELKQLGTGHYSPIACYHKESDMVLVLDVARFKYPPFFVSVEELYKAMLTIDEDTKKSRAYMVLGRNTVSAQAVFARINTADLSSFSKFKDILTSRILQVCESKKQLNLQQDEQVEVVISSLSEIVGPFIQTAFNYGEQQQQQQNNEQQAVTGFIAPMLIERKPLNMQEQDCCDKQTPQRAKFNWNALSKEHAELVKALFTSVKASSLYKLFAASAPASVDYELTEEELVLSSILFAAIPLQQALFGSCNSVSKLLPGTKTRMLFAQSFWDEWHTMAEKEIEEQPQLKAMNVEVTAVRSQLIALASSSPPISSASSCSSSLCCE